jgi:hypothetical protein
VKHVSTRFCDLRRLRRHYHTVAGGP